MNESTKKKEFQHRSVMLSEVLEILKPESGKIYVDATLGLGGHAKAILQISDNTRVIGIDQDSEAIGIARKWLKQFGERIDLFQTNFSEIKAVVKKAGVKKVRGIIADLGVSSLQLDNAMRGFSFRFDAPLDMRMNPESDDETAAELLARLSEEEIANIIYKYGEEKASRRIARRIVEKRESGEAVKTTSDLVKILGKTVKRGRHEKIHFATKTFQALRIAVNKELDVLEGFIRDSVDLLEEKGRLAVITFHSLEDRVVKRTMQNLAGKCFCPPKFPQCVCGMKKEAKILTRKPLIPGEDERRENPRARSAKLRACMKII